MVIRARYAGTCAGCGERFAAGEEIEWNKAARETYHVSCAAIANEPAPFLLSFMGGHRSEAPTRGTVLWSDEHHQAVTVVRVRASYMSPDDAEDQDFFELANAGGWSFAVYCRAATTEEAEPVLAERADAIAQAEARQAIAQLKAQIQRDGERPEGIWQPGGVRVLDTQTIYGGGDWFVVSPSHLWYVQNNGADGDDWGANNVRTGGAGAIGWRIPYDAAIADQLRTHAATLGQPIDTTDGPEDRRLDISPVDPTDAHRQRCQLETTHSLADAALLLDTADPALPLPSRFDDPRDADFVAWLRTNPPELESAHSRVRHAIIFDVTAADDRLNPRRAAEERARLLRHGARVVVYGRPATAEQVRQYGRIWGLTPDQQTTIYLDEEGRPWQRLSTFDSHVALREAAPHAFDDWERERYEQAWLAYDVAVAANLTVSDFHAGQVRPYEGARVLDRNTMLTRTPDGRLAGAVEIGPAYDLALYVAARWTADPHPTLLTWLNDPDSTHLQTFMRGLRTAIHALAPFAGHTPSNPALVTGEIDAPFSRGALLGLWPKRTADNDYLIRVDGVEHTLAVTKQDGVEIVRGPGATYAWMRDGSLAGGDGEVWDVDRLYPPGWTDEQYADRLHADYARETGIPIYAEVME